MSLTPLIRQDAIVYLTMYKEDIQERINHARLIGADTTRSTERLRRVNDCILALKSDYPSATDDTV